GPVGPLAPGQRPRVWCLGIPPPPTQRFPPPAGPPLLKNPPPPLLALPRGKDRQKCLLQLRAVRVPGGVVTEAWLVLPLGVAQRLGEAVPRRLAGAGHGDELAALGWVGAIGGRQVIPHPHALAAP